MHFSFFLLVLSVVKVDASKDRKESDFDYTETFNENIIKNEKMNNKTVIGGWCRNVSQ